MKPEAEVCRDRTVENAQLTEDDGANKTSDACNDVLVKTATPCSTMLKNPQMTAF